MELCSHYDTTGHPSFKPRCLLGHRAGLWCHKYDAPHHCNKYRGDNLKEEIEESQTVLAIRMDANTT